MVHNSFRLVVYYLRRWNESKLDDTFRSRSNIVILAAYMVGVLSYLKWSPSSERIQIFSKVSCMYFCGTVLARLSRNENHICRRIPRQYQQNNFVPSDAAFPSINPQWDKCQEAWSCPTMMIAAAAKYYQKYYPFTNDSSRCPNQHSLRPSLLCYD